MTVDCPFCGTKIQVLSGIHADDIVENGCVSCRKLWKETSDRLLAQIEGLEPSTDDITEKPKSIFDEDYPWGN